MATNRPSASIALNDGIIETTERVEASQGHQDVDEIIWCVALFYEKGNSDI